MLRLGGAEPDARRVSVEALHLLALAEGVKAPSQQVVVQGSGHRMRLSVTHGTGPWHWHPNTTETFVVLLGQLTLDFRDGSRAVLGVGDALCVPVGVLHRSRAEGRTVSVSVEVAEPQVTLEE